MKEEEKEILRRLILDIAELKKEATRLWMRINETTSNVEKENAIQQYCEVIYMILDLHKNMLGRQPTVLSSKTMV